MQHDDQNGDTARSSGRAPSRVGPPPVDRGGPVAPVSQRVREDALGALRWNLGHHVRLFAFCVLVVPAAVMAFLVFRPVENQATALVVAQRLDMDLVALPRLGEAVFDNGAVAQKINDKFGTTGDVADIVPDRVSLVSEQDSIVFSVTGHDPSPVTAASIANTAAETFTTQLNVPGEGVGYFALQSPAVSTVQLVQQGPGPLVLLPISLVAGALLGVAVVAGVGVIRRPVLDVDGAVDATGVPALGWVSLPRTRDGRCPDLSEIPGIVPLCRRLLAAGVQRVVLVGPTDTARARRQLIVAMSYLISQVRCVRLVVDDDVAVAARTYAGASPEPSTGDAAARPAELVLADGSQLVDPLPIAREMLTVLVVARGASTTALRNAAVEHLGGADGASLLLVHEHRSVRRHRHDAPARPPSSTVPEGATGPRPAAPDRVSTDH